MATNERQRRLVYDSLEAAVGTVTTDFVMERLLEHPRSDLATREDVAATATLLRGEMAELRSELRGEMVELRSELRGEMAELRSELRGEMAELRSELRADMAALSLDIGRELRSQLRTIMVALAGFFVALVLAGLYI